jgi:hypothetical protein
MSLFRWLARLMGRPPRPEVDEAAAARERFEREWRARLDALDLLDAVITRREPECDDRG